MTTNATASNHHPHAGVVTQTPPSQTAGCFRSPEMMMQPQRLGAFHTSYLSFSRSLMRTMRQQQWTIKQHHFNLDDNGFGHVVYQIKTPTQHYHAVFFTRYLAAEQRNDRVIANAWDLSCCLWYGAITTDDIDQLAKHLPQQEKGRYSANVFSLSRANKSVRLFDYVVDCLANGNQPDRRAIQKTGYLVRTTAVYGNGKFGLADYLRLQGTDFADCFRAQLLTVYLVRHFSLEWVEFLARTKKPETAVRLSRQIALFFGVGNSTGLGMLPFLIKHPQVIDTWIRQREQALYQIMHTTQPDAHQINTLKKIIHRGINLFHSIDIPDTRQTLKNKQLTESLKALSHFLTPLDNQYNCWPSIYQHIQDVNWGHETEELFLNMLLEIYPNIASQYDRFTHVPDRPTLKPQVTINDVIEQIEAHYSWAIAIDFSRVTHQHYFWYRSADKEEPRQGIRRPTLTTEKEMKITVAQAVNTLYTRLTSTPDRNQSMVSFLMQHPSFSGTVKRVLHYPDYPFGEIRANIIAKDFYPIDIMRLKLSFLGAIKFDPKSDKWLRITLFQGAPLTDEQGQITADDNSFLYHQ